MTPPPAKLGILMLDTRFPRIPGDVGNPATWEFPVVYARIPGATPQAIVREDASRFVEAFVARGRALVAEGCAGIATTCGFLALIRAQLAAELDVPVAASALEQAAQIRGMLAPDRPLGVLTISQSSLTPAHLAAARVPEDTLVEGVEDTGFGQAILQDAPDLDVAEARRDLVAAACRLTENAPQIGALLLECTNMVPYAPDIRRETGLPVYSIYTYLTWFYQSLQPRAFPTGS